MKERPILFSGEMVRAILDGRKTQTRRVIKPQPRSDHNGFHWPKHGVYLMGYGTQGALLCDMAEFCPYGQPGDLLWVRETWQECILCGAVNYRAGESVDCHTCAAPFGQWHPSIFMPRLASRITLGVTGMRVERVHDISEEDAKSEGVTAWHSPHPNIEKHNRPGGSYRNGFHDLWDSINAKRGFGWDANPWVWVVEFHNA